MSVFPVPFMLCFAVIVILKGVKSLFNFFERIFNCIFLFLIVGQMESLITIPVNIVQSSFVVNVFAVIQIKSSVVMFRIISSILSRSSVVSRQLHSATSPPSPFVGPFRIFCCNYLQLHKTSADNTQYKVTYRHFTGPAFHSGLDKAFRP